MKKSDFHYNLPERLIAQTPLTPRDSSRLLVYKRKEDQIIDQHFYDITKYLKKGDVLVINDTKVIPARLIGKRADTGAIVEIFLLEKISMTRWEVLVKPGKKARVSHKIIFSDKLSCTIIDIKQDDGNRIVEFEYEGLFENILDELGQVPLPPYIKTKLTDPDKYQTVYSKNPGSKAAPTAGLHFTKQLIKKIKDMGVEFVKVTLDIGLGTFRPVKTNNIEDHLMHKESYILTKQAADKLNKAKSESRRIIPVGTTSVRVLESAFDKNDQKFYKKQAKTDIFIYPGYKFQAVDALITNFHLPESTLIMLVSAFAGLDKTMKIYEYAVKEEYRFFSFGDCMFIE